MNEIAGYSNCVVQTSRESRAPPQMYKTSNLTALNTADWTKLDMRGVDELITPTQRLETTRTEIS